MTSKKKDLKYAIPLDKVYVSQTLSSGLVRPTVTIEH
jgi:hypothetical protein